MILGINLDLGLKEEGKRESCVNTWKSILAGQWYEVRMEK